MRPCTGRGRWGRRSARRRGSRRSSTAASEGRHGLSAVRARRLPSALRRPVRQVRASPPALTGACRATVSARHRFTELLPREEAWHDPCEVCERAVHLHEGPPAARHYQVRGAGNRGGARLGGGGLVVGHLVDLLRGQRGRGRCRFCARVPATPYFRADSSVHGGTAPTYPAGGPCAFSSSVSRSAAVTANAMTPPTHTPHTRRVPYGAASARRVPSNTRPTPSTQ